MWTLERLQQLIESGAEETQTLEFKGAASLDRTRPGTDWQSDLVKAVSGFANAGGGRVIYGIRTQRPSGAGPGRAIHLDPIHDPRTNEDHLTTVLHSNVAPPMRCFSVHGVGVGDGRVFVIEVEQSHTAHQNIRDKRYYQRIGTTTEPMADFQIRDAMNRRTSPVIEVCVRQIPEPSSPTTRNFLLQPELINVGTVSAQEWRFELLVPTRARADFETKFHITPMTRLSERMNGVDFIRYVYHHRLSERFGLDSLHPGQHLVFLENIGFPRPMVRVDPIDGADFKVQRPDISWVLYLPDAPPVKGSIPFDEWWTTNA